jgi:cytochrome c553
VKHVLFRVTCAAMALSASCAVLAAAGEGAPAQAPDTLEQRLIACSACHGKQGEGLRENEYYPRIAGKPSRYLYNQLVNFRDGRRTYAQMVYLVAYLSDDYLMEIANHYSKLQPGYPTPIAPALKGPALSRGEVLVREGDSSKGIPACAACHGKALTGMQPAIPGLVGLYPDYINAQLGAWQGGARHAAQPDCMATIAAKLTGSDIVAVSAWLSAQPGSPGSLPAPDQRQRLPMACGSQQ